MTEDMSIQDRLREAAMKLRQKEERLQVNGQNLDELLDEAAKTVDSLFETVMQLGKKVKP